MVRRYTPEVKKRSFRVVYWIGVIVIVAGWVWAFKTYFDRYEFLHPDVTWAVPGVDNRTVTVKGLLLWKEAAIQAPASGIVTYPLGLGPQRVGKGAVVARVAGRDVRAPQQGYFVAGKDGRESSWRYSAVWSSKEKDFLKSYKISMFKNNSSAVRGQTIGKIIEQPQDLRFVGYMSVNGDVEEQLERKKLRVRIDSGDTVSTAKIRVTQEAGKKIKIYLTLPWFPAEFVKSRNYTLTIDAGQTRGALVPASAVAVRDGRLGIFLVRGASVIFVPVEGVKTPGGGFLVTKGISVGDAVVENAAEAREGRIRLW